MSAGCHFLVVNWVVKNSFHEFMLLSDRILNHIMAAPLRVRTNSLHFIGSRAW